MRAQLESRKLNVTQTEVQNIELRIETTTEHIAHLKDRFVRYSAANNLAGAEEVEEKITSLYGRIDELYDDIDALRDAH
jgi:hypothetical protein